MQGLVAVPWLALTQGCFPPVDAELDPRFGRNPVVLHLLAVECRICPQMRNGNSFESVYEETRKDATDGTDIVNGGLTYHSFLECARRPQPLLAEILAGLVLGGWLFFLLPMTCCWCARRPLLCIARNRHRWTASRLTLACVTGTGLALGGLLLCIAAEVTVQRAIDDTRLATCTGFRLLEASIMGTERQKRASSHSPGTSFSQFNSEKGFCGAIFLARHSMELQRAVNNPIAAWRLDEASQRIADVLADTTAQQKARGRLQELAIHLAS